MRVNFNKTCIPFIAVLLAANILHATTRKVLFIGNSYTYTNNMPLMLKTLALNLGDTLIYDESDPGGYTFAQHCTYAPTISKIFSQQWDVVVLQEQSELPSFPPDEVDTEVYPYAHRLDSMIHANDTCTQTMFLMTWGHADGDPPNCAFYPVICTYEGMQQRLRDSYMQMTLDNHAVVAPVGVAWRIMMDSFPSIWLYIADSSHPVVPGSYLESCVLYSSIFHKRTSPATYTSGLTAGVADTLRGVADRVVFDSFAQWQQHGHYPYAGFTTALTGSSATFTNLSAVSASNYWAFGDGAHDASTAPTHTYVGSGTYVVSHTVYNDCFTETLRDTIHLGTTLAPNQSNGGLLPITTRQDGSGSVTFIVPANQAYDILEVYDATGRSVRKYSLNNTAFTDHFAPGMYLYRVYAKDGNRSLNGKLIVY